MKKIHFNSVRCLMSANTIELIVFFVYFVAMLVIGVYFFIKSKDAGGKKYFLAEREMGPWVTALSAGASDMSAWVLMGLPASIYALGTSQAWIAVGLFIGYSLSWFLLARRLRRFSILADDSITIPEYLTKRFLSESKTLRVLCAIIFLLAYTVYTASGIKACGTLLSTVSGLSSSVSMFIAASIVIAYTFLGGFEAVSWTDFFQGLLMLGALLAAPIFAYSLIQAGEIVPVPLPEGFLSPNRNITDIISGLGWGLGYFGMPHIIVRFMAIRSEKDVKTSRRIALGWTFLILIFSVLVGVAGRQIFPDLEDSSLVFIMLTRKLFPPLVCGIILSAILAAAMSTADSQLLCSASTFSCDIYKPIFKKNATDKEMLKSGRVLVIIISAVALFIAANPKSGTIMSLVENAWGIFGASFGPVILLSLYWKRMTYTGAFFGIFAGAAVDILVLVTRIIPVYEIIPGFIAGLLGAWIASLLSKEPLDEVYALFAEGVKREES